MGNLRSSGIIYQAQLSEESIVVQAGGSKQEYIAGMATEFAAVQSSLAASSQEALIKEILKKDRRLLAEMSSKKVNKSVDAINYSVAYAGSNKQKLDEEKGVADEISEDDVMFDFNKPKERNIKRFEDFSTMMGNQKKKSQKKGKFRKNNSRNDKAMFNKKLKADSRFKFPKGLKQKKKMNQRKSQAENKTSSEFGLKTLVHKQDIPVRIILGIIAGVAFITIVLLGRRW